MTYKKKKVEEVLDRLLDRRRCIYCGEILLENQIAHQSCLAEQARRLSDINRAQIKKRMNSHTNSIEERINSLNRREE